VSFFQKPAVLAASQNCKVSEIKGQETRGETKKGGVNPPYSLGKNNVSNEKKSACPVSTFFNPFLF